MAETVATAQNVSLVGTNVTIATGQTNGTRVDSVLVGNKSSGDRYIRLTIGGAVVGAVKIPTEETAELVVSGKGLMLANTETFQIAAFTDFAFTTGSSANEVGYHASVVEST